MTWGCAWFYLLLKSMVIMLSEEITYKVDHIGHLFFTSDSDTISFFILIWKGFLTRLGILHVE